MPDPDRILRQGGRLLPPAALRYDVTPGGLHHALPGLGLPDVDEDAWRLVVGGHTRYALGLSLPGLQRRPQRTVEAVLQAPGLPGAASQARWTGTPLGPIVQESAPLDGARHLVFHGLDWGVVDGEVRRGELRLGLDLATSDGVLLAWAMNGRPLPLEHGGPLRLLVPGREERASLRWLAAISVDEGPLPEGAEPGVLPPCAVLEPPGLLEQESGLPSIWPGPVTLRGRAWTGSGAVGGVQVSTDGGESWQDADLASTEPGPGWVGWTASWDAPTGGHRLGVRATEAGGATGEVGFLDVRVLG